MSREPPQLRFAASAWRASSINIAAANCSEIVKPSSTLELALHLEGPEVAGPYLEYLDAKARVPINARWLIVEALAPALLEQKVLSGVAARRVMRQATLQRL